MFPTFPPIKGLIDYATFQRESKLSATEIDHRIAGGVLRPVIVGRSELRFFITDIPETFGSLLLCASLCLKAEASFFELRIALLKALKVFVHRGWGGAK